MVQTWNMIRTNAIQSQGARPPGRPGSWQADRTGALRAATRQRRKTANRLGYSYAGLILGEMCANAHDERTQPVFLELASRSAHSRRRAVKIFSFLDDLAVGRQCLGAAQEFRGLACWREYPSQTAWAFRRSRRRPAKHAKPRSSSSRARRVRMFRPCRHSPPVRPESRSRRSS